MHVRGAYIRRGGNQVIPARKKDRFNLRASQQQHSLIRRAAEQTGVSYTDFILESATERATAVLSDQRMFILDSDRWARFVDALDAPAQPVAALVELFKNGNL
ncbi:MAG: DUF1778 domain-containing protein [Candidatus Dormibacteraceae bacterium]